MMVLQPCRNCGFSKGCEKKKEMFAILRPAKLRTARFKCGIQDESLPPGSFAEISLRWVAKATEDGTPDVYMTEGGLYPEPTAAKLHGIVLRREKRGDKYWVFIPRQSGGSLLPLSKFGQQDGQIHFAKVFHSAIRITGGGVAICKKCMLPESASDEEKGDWRCRMDYNDHGEWGREYYETDHVFETLWRKEIE